MLVGIPVADGVAVETGALISFKGASTEITVPDFGTATGNINFTYLDVPALGRFRVVRGSRATVHALAGVTLGLKLSAEQSASFMGETITEDIDDVSGFDLGLTFGGRVEIGRALVDVRYTFGMLNLAEEEGPNGETIKNRVLSFMAGWRF
ncbi:MAG TPA: porin family protein [Vicinamibacterales bacterium]|nr:porin family protein [Vicinamibacterales bacterium]